MRIHTLPLILGLAVILASVAPEDALGQRPIATLRPMRPPIRTRLPSILAVYTDSGYQLLLPSLYERRSIFRFAAGEWTVVERILARDSIRAVRELVGQPVGLYVDGDLGGSGRVRAVPPNFCAEPPEWCPPLLRLDVAEDFEPGESFVVAVNPPPMAAWRTDEPRDEEVALAARSLFTVLRAGLAPRVVLREDQVGEPSAFVVEDSATGRRVLVAAVVAAAGDGATQLVGLVVGTVVDGQVLRFAAGRTSRSASAEPEELRCVTALDLDGDQRVDLLLGWRSGDYWRFEILKADVAGRWMVRWSGPNRALPPAGRSARR